jgi:hypothetical protein
MEQIENVSSSHKARTETNRLIGEKSPYLLQHAYNPVAWYPWGNEAFERAQKEDKPIFLSIGYSTCHWCHVMESESFEDDEVARLLNDSFVSIKVDREERPDIDNIYMTVCQLMTRGGGWPLTIIMTPEKKPFFAATYIPKNARFGRPGMLELLPEISSAWQTHRQDLLQATERILSALEQVSQTNPGKAPGEEALHLAFRQLAVSFDSKHGGFGVGMKFPAPHQLIFLLRYFKRTGNKGALEMAEKTLVQMRLGGIFDQLGFGFHRYSTDPEWLVPHFEKMLYDQALMILAYTEAFEVTGKQIYKQTAREVATYVLRDLTSSDGAFFSAEDADSEGVEGKFYIWDANELMNILPTEDARRFMDMFGIKAKGNFSDESTGTPSGHNILHCVGAEWQLDEDMERSHRRLMEVREQRIRPLKDDKILTDWNGLMVGALARAAWAFNEPTFERAAKRAADFLLKTLKDEDGRLLHRYRGGVAGLPAHLDDYAFLAFGLIELYEATFETKYLKKAIELNKVMLGHFIDRKQGGFFLTADNEEPVLVRLKERYDDAIPSGSSVAIHNLLRLARITGEAELEKAADKAAGTYADDIETQAMGHTFFLSAIDFALGPSLEVVISGKKGAKDTQTMLDTLRQTYEPNKIVLLRNERSKEELVSLAPFVASQEMKQKKATAYVCMERSCSFPTNNPRNMLELIKKLSVERIIKSESKTRQNTS